MPFCPQCSYEYQDSVKTCPECKVDLVPQLEKTTVSDEDFEEIYSVFNRMEAEVIRSLLEEKNLEFLVRDMRIFPVLPEWGASYRISVHVDAVADARKIIEEARQDGALTNEGKFL